MVRTITCSVLSDSCMFLLLIVQPQKHSARSTCSRPRRTGGAAQCTTSGGPRSGCSTALRITRRRRRRRRRRRWTGRGRRRGCHKGAGRTRRWRPREQPPTRAGKCQRGTTMRMCAGCPRSSCTSEPLTCSGRSRCWCAASTLPRAITRIWEARQRSWRLWCACTVTARTSLQRQPPVANTKAALSSFAACGGRSRHDALA